MKRPPSDAATADPSTSNHTRLPWNVRLLGLGSLLNDVASEMVYPLIPTFLLKVIGATKEELGIIEGVAETTASLLKLFSGSLSDRLGKRKVFVVSGYLLAAVSRPLMALARAPWHVGLVRFSDRFGKGIRSSAREAMIADSTSPAARGRAFGFTQAMDHLGAAVGPSLAALFLLVWPEQFRALFLLTVIPGAVVVLLVLFGLREQPITTQAGKDFQLTLKPFSNDFRWYLLALVIFTLGNSSDAFLLVRVQELGVPIALVPLLWAAFQLVKSALTVVAGSAVDRLGPRPLIYAGWIIYAGIYLAFSLATTALEGCVFFLLYGMFFALTEPAERTMVANLVASDRKGLAYGWFNFAIGIAALPSSIIFGWLYEGYGAKVAFSYSAILALGAVALLATLGRKAAKPGTVQ